MSCQYLISQLSCIFTRRFRRKCTTLTLAYFFRQFNTICPLFLFICSTLSATNFQTFRSRKHSTASFLMFPKEGRRKRSFFVFFSALCDFFPKFLNSIKGYPLEFFWKLSVCEKRSMSLNGLFLRFSTFCGFFYQMLFKF